VEAAEAEVEAAEAQVAACIGRAWMPMEQGWNIGGRGRQQRQKQ
jgi:hypothetical protein